LNAILLVGSEARAVLPKLASQRTDASYRSGPSKVWLKSKNSASEAARREREKIGDEGLRPSVS
jgi:hypothetical protein